MNAFSLLYQEKDIGGHTFTVKRNHMGLQMRIKILNDLADVL